MRLLNVKSRRLYEFLDSYIPAYAILSHTWEEQEVTFQELERSDHQQKISYAKIDHCCKQAEEDGLEWVWIDTCCINKDSSAELSEAINSMFRWYKNADICYIYLSDFSSKKRSSRPSLAFRKSRWFTRGWTLQELLAPEYRVFYDSTWSVIGAIHNTPMHMQLERKSFRKSVQNDCHSHGHHPEYGLRGGGPAKMLDLGAVVCDITGIELEVIRHQRDPTAVIAAKKMAWASGRETSRIEDIAYSLLGIFGVNMPLLYGEGHRAFIRFQEEIIRATYDHSIFSWGLGGSYRCCFDADWRLFARHPDDFKPFGRFATSLKTILGGSHYYMTNLGLYMELLVIFLGKAQEAVQKDSSSPCNHMTLALGLLDATTEDKTTEGRIAIPLVILPKSGHHFRVARCRGSAPFMIPAAISSNAQRYPMYLSEEAPSTEILAIEVTTIKLDPSEGWRVSDYFPPTIRVEPGGDWNQTIMTSHDYGGQILIRYYHCDHCSLLLLLTNNKPPDAVPALELTKRPLKNTRTRYATMAMAIQRDWCIWTTLLEPNYNEFRIQPLLKTLNWGMSCDFAPTQRAIISSLPDGNIKITILDRR